MRAIVLRTALWLCLGSWLGAWALFAFVIAPTAFRVLPSTEVAGSFVGPILQTLHLFGTGAGLALVFLGWSLDRDRLLVLLPGALAVACLMSEFGLTASITDVLPHLLGPASGPDDAARFDLLHRMSRLLYGLVGAGLLVLVALHARADAPDV